MCPPPESYLRDLKDFSLEHVVLDPFSWGLWVEGSLCRCFRDLSDSFVEHEIWDPISWGLKVEGTFDAERRRGALHGSIEGVAEGSSLGQGGSDGSSSARKPRLQGSIPYRPMLARRCPGIPTTHSGTCLARRARR